MDADAHLNLPEWMHGKVKSVDWKTGFFGTRIKIEFFKEKDENVSQM